MSDRIIIKNTTSEANLSNIQSEDILNGEMLLVRETDKESLYCKNTNNEISKIHRITDCGGFSITTTTPEYEAVDLGLPSGLLWANKNIGAKTEDDTGLYFQWGDTVGYTLSQVGVDKQFADDWSDYKFGVYPDFTKYNSTDGLTTLEAADDAARVNMGSDWKIPTENDFIELINNTDIRAIIPETSEEQEGYLRSETEFTVVNNGRVNSLKFYNKNNHDRFIIIPVNGNLVWGNIENVNINCTLISSTLSNSIEAYSAFSFTVFDGTMENIGGYSYRYNGVPIRAVKQQQ